MKVHRLTRCWLHPGTEAKAKRLHELVGACRFAWSHFVGELRKDWKRYQVQSLVDWRNAKYPDARFYSLGKRFTALRRGVAWLQEYFFAIVRQLLKSIETTYKNFYKKHGSLPRFRAKHFYDPSFPLLGGSFKINGKWLYVAKIGELALCGYNPYPGGKPVSGTVKCEAGKWYA